MKIHFFLLLLPLVFISNFSSAQELSFCNWFEDKKAAVVLTYDDWLEGQEKIVVPAMIKRNLVGTYFITVNNTKYRSTSFPTMRLAFKNGSEIANHTLTHPDLTSITFEEAKKEIDETRQLILDSIPGAKSLTFAYPMGTKNQKIINYLKNNHIAARSVSHAIERNLKYDFASDNNDYYKINTVRVWRVLSTNKVSHWLKYAEKGGGLLTFMTHSIYNDDLKAGWDGMSEEYLNELLDTVKAHENNLWITTLEKATQYHKEKKDTKIKVIKTSRKKIQFELISTLNPEQYFHLLTMKIVVDREGMKKLKLNGKKIEFIQKNGCVLIEVNPHQLQNELKFYY